METLGAVLSLRTVKVMMAVMLRNANVANVQMARLLRRPTGNVAYKCSWDVNYEYQGQKDQQWRCLSETPIQLMLNWEWTCGNTHTLLPCQW